MSEENYIELTADIVAAYVANNSVQATNLASLIESVYTAVAGLDKPPAPTIEAKAPAVNPKKSIFPDYIICLEDGKRFKTLKRHLATDFGLTPEAYRAKWQLNSDYPMVAPNYAAQRSALALKLGLGRKKVEPTRSRAKSKPTARTGRAKKA